MIVNKVDQKIKTNIRRTTEYQILTYCYFNDIQISSTDLSILGELALLNEHELTDFCKIVASQDIFKSPQSARNAITKAEKKGLIKKNGVNKKTIIVSEELNIQTDGVVLLDFKILGQ
jgi:hypothetical protein